MESPEQSVLVLFSRAIKGNSENGVSIFTKGTKRYSECRPESLFAFGKTKEIKEKNVKRSPNVFKSLDR